MSPELFAQLVAVIAPVLIAAALGYGWAKLGWPMDTALVTRLVTHVATPCLVVHTLLSVDLSPAALGEMALIAATVMAAMGLASAGLIRLAGWPQSAFLPSMTFGNIGNMGLPLCLFAFGEEGLALAIAYFTVGSVAQFILGPAAASGRLSPLAPLRTPIVWAVGAAVALMLLDLDPPAWANNTLGLLGGMAIPLMLMMLGVSLANLTTAGLGRGAVLSAWRLLGGFAVGYAVVLAFDLDGVARGVVLIQAAMPVAVFNYLFAAMHENRKEEVAGLVLISTLLSFATLPVLLLIAL